MTEIRDQFRTGELNIVCQNCLGNKDVENFSKV